MTREARRATFDGRLDPALAALTLVAWWLEVLTKEHRPRLLGVVLAAIFVAVLPIIWRRRAPLAFTGVVMVLIVIMTATVTNVSSWVAPVYLLLLAPYTVAAYEPRNRALIGMAMSVAAAWGVSSFSGAHVGDYFFTGGLVVGAWAAGRALRARRLLASELRTRAERIAAERDSRIRLAVADERTRIARELHALVANSVSAMVVQTEAATRLLDDDLDRADQAMAAVETTGREALSEMRRILGVLRRPDEQGAELAPQPGVGQIHALVERAREQGRRVTLDVDGEPGPLPASVDLSVYRTLEEALEGAADLGVALRFGERDVELDVISETSPGDSWPTVAMRERCDMCGGELHVEETEEGQVQLRVRMPRSLEEEALVL